MNNGKYSSYSCIGYKLLFYTSFYLDMGSELKLSIARLSVNILHLEQQFLLNNLRSPVRTVVRQVENFESNHYNDK